MIILAHRGLWSRPEERNTLTALETALAEGFGVETDLRDFDGRVVISHDPPGPRALPFADFLDAYRRWPAAGIMALNIKADGLQGALAGALQSRGIGPDHYFVFDMAVPDALGYLRLGMPCFTRQSEVEPVPAFIDQAAGVWLDCFHQDWIDATEVLKHCGAGRRVVLVSPELHGRPWQGAWGQWREAYRSLLRNGQDRPMMLCTDHPREAKAYFDAPD